MRIAVVGLGHVGLPLAALLARRHTVVGLESNESRIRAILDAGPGFFEPGLNRILKSAVDSGGLLPTSEPSKIKQCRVKIITVGTPYDRRRHRFDSSQLDAAVRAVATQARPGDVVLLKSTVPPGTTLGRVRRAVEREGFRVPSDIGLAFSPERIVEGRAIRDFRSLPKVIGATDPRTFRRVERLLGPLGGGVVPVKDPTTAELVKLVDNYARYSFLALTNELGMLCRSFGTDALEVLAAAKQDYPRNAGLLQPGPGVGGSCLNKDPFLLADASSEKGIAVEMLKAAQRVNDSMPTRVVDLVRSSARGRRKLVIAGVGFKAETDDTRFTPAIPIARALRRLGFRVALSDPYVLDSDVGSVNPDLYAASEGAEILLILTEHARYARLDFPRLARLVARPALLVDARGIVNADRARASGFEYLGLWGQ